MKPDMGVYVIKNSETNTCFLEASSDLKSTFNRAKFQLDFGNHPNQALQQAWKSNKAAFQFEVLDQLPYAKDESKTDYSEDLATLKAIWREKLSHDQGTNFYN